MSFSDEAFEYVLCTLNKKKVVVFICLFTQVFETLKFTLKIKLVRNFNAQTLLKPSCRRHIKL